MTGRVVLIGGGIILAVAIFLILKVHGGGDDAAARPTTEPATDNSSDPVASNDPPVTEHHDPSKPELPEAGSDRTPTPVVRETVIDGVRVRDHRIGKHADLDKLLPPNIHPRNSQRLPSQLVQKAIAKLQTVLKDCASALPAGAKSADSKLDGKVFVDVAQGTLQVTEAKVKIENVEGDTAELVQCFESKAVGQSVPSGDVEDTTHYGVSLLFHVR